MACLLLGLAVAACFGGGRRSDPPEGSGVWLSGSEIPDGVELRRLAAAGAPHLFIPAAVLEWSGGSPDLRFLEVPSLDRRTEVTAIVTGEWRGGAGREKELGKRLAAQAQELVLSLQSSGLSPVGLHMDVDVRGSLESYGSTLGRLRSGLPKTVLLSAGIGRDGLDDEAVAELADEVDFLVGWLYGRRPEAEAEESERLWDLDEVESGLDQLEDLGTEYMLGVATVGTAWKIALSGREEGFTHRGRLKDLVLHEALRLESGFVLSGLDTQRYEFRVLGAMRFHELQLREGDFLRYEGLTPAHLRELHRRLESKDLDHYLGSLFYRLPSPEETLSLSAGSLAISLIEPPPPSRLEVEIVPVKQRGRNWVLKLNLKYSAEQASAVGFIESNFLELVLDGGWFGRVEPGDFQRFQLLTPKGGSLQPTLHNATILRLFQPILGSGDELTTGHINLRLRGRSQRLSLRSRFHLTDGRTLAVTPQEWPVEEP